MEAEMEVERIPEAVDDVEHLHHAVPGCRTGSSILEPLDAQGSAEEDAVKSMAGAVDAAADADVEFTTEIMKECMVVVVNKCDDVLSMSPNTFIHMVKKAIKKTYGKQQAKAAVKLHKRYISQTLRAWVRDPTEAPADAFEALSRAQATLTEDKEEEEEDEEEEEVEDEAEQEEEADDGVSVKKRRVTLKQDMDVEDSDEEEAEKDKEEQEEQQQEEEEQQQEEEEDNEAEEEDEEEEEADNDSDSDYGEKRKRKRPQKKKQSSRAAAAPASSSVPSQDLPDPLSGAEDTHTVDPSHVVMLNQTDVSFGQRGHNKFYLMQLLHPRSTRKSKHPFILFTKWGRVGAPNPQSQAKEIWSQAGAVKAFEDKFKSKTGNVWQQEFQARAGKYFVVDLSSSSQAHTTVEAGGNAMESKGGSGGQAVSYLPPQLRGLLELVCSEDLLRATLNSLKVDVKACPLGRLSRDQITKGYAVLNRIAQTLDSSSSSSDDTQKTLITLSNELYSLVPQDFGMQRPPLINTMAGVAAQASLLAALGDLELAASFLRFSQSKMLPHAKLHPIDRCYMALRAQLSPVASDSSSYRMIQQMMTTSHGPTHTTYSLELCELYAVQRHGETSRSQPFSQLPKRMLLWHGSRLSNFVGILSQGLRIAPPEAPKTGYMFGKGVYFADCVSKSSNYCHATKENPYGLLVLSEVALGNIHELTAAEYLTRPPQCYHSVKGKGKYTFDDTVSQTIESSDLEAPMGCVQNPAAADSTLQYNEYIVYDVGQSRMRFLVKVKFNFSD